MKQKGGKCFPEHGFTGLFVAREEAFFGRTSGKPIPKRSENVLNALFLTVQREWTKNLALKAITGCSDKGTIYPDHVKPAGSEHASRLKHIIIESPEIERMIQEGRVISHWSRLYKDEEKLGDKLDFPRK